ncbi:UMP kinase [Candidatus Absconditicoccus praedator]|uniref:UMP kinase n=1 Tax=Candidatus Absconditicoccus praedator TaxID=2735562 RepID=UPI001E5C5158|nr:UMP kinase [Candidatus Absconditicoccus praedator]UFX83131.1 UMP kinase [Candidatus Absconditicoccus praedator]
MIKKHPKRVLLKLSGEALQGSKEYGIDVKLLEKLSEKIVYLSRYKGVQIVIVIGGGNIFRGVSGAASGIDRSQADYMGMLATVMNGIALGDAIEKQGNSVRIMSALEIPKVAETFIRRRALKHLEKGRVVLTVSGTGNPYFTTDSAAVLRALELNCDFMIKGTKVDGIYDKDPFVDSTAKKYENIGIDEALDKGLQIMDQSAIALAKDEKLPIFVCKLMDIEKILSKSIKGTYVDVT